MVESLGIALADDAVAEACRVCHKKVWGTGRGRSSESVGLIGRRVGDEAAVRGGVVKAWSWTPLEPSMGRWNGPQCIQARTWAAFLNGLKLLGVGY